MFLARKITRAKWDTNGSPANGTPEDKISADAITGDLRTRENTLSFWRCPSDRSGDVEEAALAIAAAGDRLDKIDVVLLIDEEVRADGQQIKQTEGRTAVTDLADQHVDIHDLNYAQLGKVGARVVEAIHSKRHHRLTKGYMRQLLADAFNQGRIAPDRLSDHLLEEIKRPNSI